MVSGWEFRPHPTRRLIATVHPHLSRLAIDPPLETRGFGTVKEFRVGIDNRAKQDVVTVDGPLVI